MLRRVRDCLQEFLPSSHLETRLSKSLRKSEARRENNQARKKKFKNTEYPHKETNASPSQDERATQGIFLQIRELVKNPQTLHPAAHALVMGGWRIAWTVSAAAAPVGEDSVLFLELTDTMAAAETGMQQGLRRYKTLPKPLSEL